MPFEFSTRLERTMRGVPQYSVEIPAKVSKAIGKRGNVPVVAKIEGRVDVRASIVPCGGGRHRLNLNATVRKLAKIEPGDRVRVSLEVDTNPIADPTPPDLTFALRAEDAMEAWERFAVGKRNHILQWIEKAVAESTRAKRVAKAVEVACAARERRIDRC